MGASFNHTEDGNLHLAREGGHSHRRIVHAADMTGREIERALLEAVRKDPNIFVFEHHFAIDLLSSQGGSDTICHGVDTLNTETQEVVRFISKITLLASGGAGHIYPITTDPPVATGDGVAMAHRAQAVISNMEFVQSHPTALADEGLPISNSLLEALVFARRAVQPSIDHTKSSCTDHSASHWWPQPTMPKSLGNTVLSNIIHRTREVRDELQLIMWEYVGIV